MNRSQMQLGFSLVLLGLLTGLAVPEMANPRLGLSAHLAGVAGGMFLVLLGVVAGGMTLSTRLRRVMHGCWVYATYANWAAALLGALTGASRLTPLAGAGTTGEPWAELAVGFLLITLSLAAIAGSLIALGGLARQSSQ
ncbi:MAG TPA: hypothetical protein VMG41_09445 [Gemmatimonadales bacterium]|nr:hypothetical protein [Gemmatimonadales bacterium]